MTMLSAWLLLPLLVALEWGYIGLARRLRLVDRPNARSSHAEPTVRGGGLIIVLAAMAAGLTDRQPSPWFMGGLGLVALISFVDDILPVPNRYRLAVQLLAVVALLVQLGLVPIAGWVLLPVLLVGVGTLNACNFMDGINGITALYSLVTLSTLWWLGRHDSYTSGLLPATLMGVLAFSLFNVRRKALCFAGDVGSVSVGFIILYPLGQLILREGSLLPLLLLAVYGVDSVLTILHRLWLGQNIFQAHRMHLFQWLVHRQGWSHLRVSGLYALVQGVVNGAVYWGFREPASTQTWLAFGLLAALAVTYCLTKKRLAGSPADALVSVG